MWIFSLILFIFILSLIVLVHELGHFFFAKKFGVHIDEFSIGMGPKLFGKKGKDGIEYNVRAIPIGGFVAMAGEVYEDNKKIKKEKFLCNKPWWQRAIVMIAGVVNNFILALVLIFISTFCFKTYEATLVLDDVVENTPAYDAGLVKGDEIIAVNGKSVSYVNEMTIRLMFNDESDKQVFTVLREDGTTKDVDVYPKEVVLEDGSKVSYGIKYKVKEIDTFSKKISYTFRTFFNTFDTMNLTIYGLFTGNISVKDLSGPVGIFEVVDSSISDKATFSQNLNNVIYIIWLLSLNVGYINLLPFPAFDGGRLLFIIIERIKGSPVNQKVENIIHSIGFILILLLIAVITLSDIIKLF